MGKYTKEKNVMYNSNTLLPVNKVLRQRMFERLCHAVWFKLWILTSQVLKQKWQHSSFKCFGPSKKPTQLKLLWEWLPFTRKPSDLWSSSRSSATCFSCRHSRLFWLFTLVYWCAHKKRDGFFQWHKLHFSTAYTFLLHSAYFQHGKCLCSSTCTYEKWASHRHTPSFFQPGANKTSTFF